MHKKNTSSSKHVRKFQYCRVPRMRGEAIVAGIFVCVEKGARRLSVPLVSGNPTSMSVVKECVQVQQLQPLDKYADKKLAESVLAVSKKWANDLLGTSRGEENDSDHNKDDTEEDEPNCEHCVTCYKRGLLHLCDSCPAAYHAECVESSVIEENDDLVCSMLGLSCCKVSASTLDKRAKRKLLELQKKQQGKKGK